MRNKYLQMLSLFFVATFLYCRIIEKHQEGDRFYVYKVVTQYGDTGHVLTGSDNKVGDTLKVPNGKLRPLRTNLTFLHCIVLWEEKPESGAFKYRVVTQLGDTGHVWAQVRYIKGDTIRILNE